MLTQKLPRGRVRMIRDRGKPNVERHLQEGQGEGLSHTFSLLTYFDMPNHRPPVFKYIRLYTILTKREAKETERQ